MSKYQIIEETSQSGSVKYIVEVGKDSRSSWGTNDIVWSLESEWFTLEEAEKRVESLLPPKRKLIRQYGVYASTGKE